MNFVFPQPKTAKRLREEEDEQELKRKRGEEEEVVEEEEEEEDQKAVLDRMLDEAEQVGVMDLQQVNIGHMMYFATCRLVLLALIK